MNEQEWLSTEDVGAMLHLTRHRSDFLARMAPLKWKVSARKLRLFACHWGKTAFHLMHEDNVKFIRWQLDNSDLPPIAYPGEAYGWQNYLEHYPTTPTPVWQESTEGKADLLRHLVGNPWKPLKARLPFPTAVVRMAEALYRGDDCAFALHDALLDAGELELAEHFDGTHEEWTDREVTDSPPGTRAWKEDHPRGCWAIDLILEKE